MASITIPAPQVATDLQIEQWVQKQHGFVPHTNWISHCRELYIEGAESSEANRLPWHECPPDKRFALKEAFLHFGMLERWLPGPEPHLAYSNCLLCFRLLAQYLVIR